MVALVAWTAVAAGGRRRAFSVVLVLATTHVVTSARLLAAWRAADRAAPPFLLVDLQPVRAMLDAHNVHHAYASYGPAYRMTFESGERIVASQPWNERFLHYPLPYLDEVRFAKDVAWVLTPGVPTDLPAPQAFEDALARAGGRWRRGEAGAAAVFDAFVPPFAPTVEPLPSAGPAGDGDPATLARPSPAGATTFALDAPRPLDAVTLLSAASGERLPRSMDVSVSADGVTFETVAQRRRRGERADLRWVNGHPQYVVDHDLIAIPLGGRTVAAVRVEPVLSSDPWTLSEILLHPAARSRRTRGVGRMARSPSLLGAALACPRRAASDRPRGLVLPVDAGRAPALGSCSQSPASPGSMRVKPSRAAQRSIPSETRSSTSGSACPSRVRSIDLT